VLQGGFFCYFSCPSRKVKEKNHFRIYKNCGYFEAVSLNSYEGDWDSWKKLATERLKDTKKAILRIKPVIENQMINNFEGTIPLLSI
jgi:hypothetical protein